MDKRRIKLLSIVGGVGLCATGLLFFLLVSLFGGKGTNGAAAGADGQAGSNNVIARIGDIEITADQLYENLVRSYGNEMLNRMIDNQVVRKEAKSSGISVSDEEIEEELKRMSAGYKDINEYYDAMEQQLGLSREDLHSDAEYNLLLEKIATKDISITDKQINDYMKSHQKEFKPRKEFHIQQMILPTREHAIKAMKEIDKGIDFAIIARDRSVDDASAVEGGDIGWVENDDPFIPVEILNAADKLKVGAISGVIELSNGNYAIIKIIDLKKEQQEPEDNVREKVRKQLALQNALPVKDIVEQLRKKHGAIILDNRFTS